MYQETERKAGARFLSIKWNKVLQVEKVMWHFKEATLEKAKFKAAHARSCFPLLMTVRKGTKTM
jgi:hypothetical protein